MLLVLDEELCGSSDFVNLTTNQPFQEFLNKEFSAENITFWTACEEYKRLRSDSERHSAAIDIMDKHLSAGAPEPVNVDSHARQAAQDGMATTGEGLFAAAQKQIYNLMKFDSYSRFLKSDLYKEALLAEMSGNEIKSATADEQDKSSLGRTKSKEDR